MGLAFSQASLNLIDIPVLKNSYGLIFISKSVAHFVELLNSIFTLNKKISVYIKIKSYLNKRIKFSPLLNKIFSYRS